MNAAEQPRKKDPRGRKPTGRREVHSYNMNFDPDVYAWLKENVKDRDRCKWLNNLIRKEAGLC